MHPRAAHPFGHPLLIMGNFAEIRKQFLSQPRIRMILEEGKWSNEASIPSFPEYWIFAEVAHARRG